MSQWIERVKTHPIFGEMAALGSTIDRASSRWTNDAASRTSVERLRSVLTFCGRRVAATDADLIDPRSLAAITQALSGVRAEVEAFLGDDNATHLDSAHTHADDALAAAASVAAAATPDDLTWINEATAAYRTTIENHLRDTLAKYAEIHTANEATRQSLSEANAELATIKERLTGALAEQQSQFSTAQDTRATEFSAAQTERQARNAAIVSEMQTAFSTAQNERQEKFTAAAAEQQLQHTAAQDVRSKEFSTAQSERAATYSTLLSGYTSSLDEHQKELSRLRDAAGKASDEALAALKEGYEGAAKTILLKIEHHLAQVEKLVGVIGDRGVTSGYQKTANRAQKAAYLWQFFTVLALGGLIYFAYLLAFAPPIADALFVQGLSTRIFLSLTVGVFAAYSAKQASNNLDIERRHRKLALELEALGPFLAPLPTEMQHKFRTDIGDRSFGIPDGPSRTSDKDPVATTDLLQLLRDIVLNKATK